MTTTATAAAQATNRTAWLALLRAVNVGGRNRIAMADMRDLMTGLGYPEATTYLQSGNVLFSADASLGGDELAATITAAVADTFDHDITVIMRTRADLDRIVAEVPWEYPANSSSGVVFMNGPVPVDLPVDTHQPDELRVAGSDIHVDIPTGFGQTKLTVAWIEKRTGLRGTRRNWKTVKALRDRLATT